MVNPVLLLALATGFSLLLPGSSSADEPKAARGLEEIVADKFNPDVTDAGRAAPSPRRGGGLRLRTPTDFDQFNVLTTTAAPSRTVLNHMTDSLVNRDPETLEYYGEIAWHWREFDLLRPAGGYLREGRIIENDGGTVTFSPGSWRGFWNHHDVAEINADEGYIVLTGERGGGRIEGRVTAMTHTVSVDTAHAGEAREAWESITVSDLATDTISMGSMEETLPFAKENCGFEFHLREGVTWHDGEPFTGHDVVFSFETIMNPAVESQHLRSIYGEIDLCETNEAGDIVRFHYHQPYYEALSVVAGENSMSGASYFLPRHVFDPGQYGGDETAFAEAFNNHPFKDSPFYTGPYRFVEYRRGESLVIRRNEGYWKNKLPGGAIPRWTKGQPWLDEIRWILYREASTVIRDLAAGRIDGDLDVEPSTWVQAETNTPDFLEKMIRARRTGFLYTYIGWNLEREIFADPDVRRALAMLIPRREIAENVHYGLAFPVDGPFYYNSPAYNHDVEPITHDPRAAMRLLGRAGWRDRTGDGIREKEINGRMVQLEFEYAIHNARDYHQKIADIIKESLEQAGIRVNINRSDWAIFLRKAREKNFDAIRLAWAASMDPDPFVNWHSSQAESGGNNTVSYRNAEVDELTVRLRRTMEPEKRWEMARDIHRIIARDQPYCFLFGFEETYFLHRGLRGIKLYPSVYPMNFSEWWWHGQPEG